MYSRIIRKPSVCMRLAGCSGNMRLRRMRTRQGASRSAKAPASRGRDTAYTSQSTSRRLRLSIHRRRRQYIAVRSGPYAGERSKSALPRSIMILTALCMTVLLAAAGYSAVKYAGEYRSANSNNGAHEEPNTVRRQYIVPSALHEDAYKYRPAGYSDNIGTALAAALEANKDDAMMKYDVVIDTSSLVSAFNKTYTLAESGGETIYWSDMTAYQKYLLDFEDITVGLERGNVSFEDAQSRLALLRDDYAMTMLDYRNAESGWIEERRKELGALYAEIADGKYYAKLLASEIHSLADEGYTLLGVGNENAGISGKYEKYLDGGNVPLLWYLSRCRPDEPVTLECRIRYSDGYPTVPSSNLLSALEKRLDKAGIESGRIDGESVRSARVRLSKNGYTAAICRLTLTPDEALSLLDSAPDCTLGYVFTDDSLLAEYRFAVHGDGFAYRTELVRIISNKKNA